MITVAILINGQPIIAQAAKRIEDFDDGTALYKIMNSGKEIVHRPEDGAVELSKKLLDTIDE